MTDNLNALDQNSAELIRGAGATEDCHLGGMFTFECFDEDGNLKWQDTAKNIVTNQGKNGMMNTYLSLAPAIASAWYMSLITAGTAISTSTYAAPTVTEITASIVAARPSTVFATASLGSIATSTTAFTVIGTATVIGNMVITNTSSGLAASVGSTAGTGILFSSSSFTGGSKNISSGDTLNVSYSLSI